MGGSPHTAWRAGLVRECFGATWSDSLASDSRDKDERADVVGRGTADGAGRVRLIGPLSLAEIKEQ
jgi:hypothetical protein